MTASEIWLNILLTLFVIVGLGLMVYSVQNEIEINNSIVTQSEEYVTYNHCNKIQGKYYCKNWEKSQFFLLCGGVF